jgi:hypothetical protein
MSCRPPTVCRFADGKAGMQRPMTGRSVSSRTVSMTACAWAPTLPRSVESQREETKEAGHAARTAAVVRRAASAAGR